MYNTSIMGGSSSLSSSPPAVSDLCPSLYTGDYNRLSSAMKKLFLRLYRAVWSYLWPLSRLGDVSQVYDLPAVLRTISPATLTAYEFLLLSRFWSLSFGGVRVVDSRAVKQLQVDSYTRAVAYRLQKFGLITRSYFDPSRPHKTSHRAMNHVFISITPKGITYFKKVLKALNRTVARDHLDYENYRHEKGQID